jgi:hypothetical protein
VHWPLWPEPFPPFVGGAGSARAVPIVAANKMPANMLANALRAEIFMSHASFPLQISARVRSKLRQAAARLERSCLLKSSGTAIHADAEASSSDNV